MGVEHVSNTGETTYTQINYRTVEDESIGRCPRSLSSAQAVNMVTDDGVGTLCTRRQDLHLWCLCFDCREGLVVAER